MSATGTNTSVLASGQMSHQTVIAPSCATHGADAVKAHQCHELWSHKQDAERETKWHNSLPAESIHSCFQICKSSWNPLRFSRVMTTNALPLFIGHTVLLDRQTSIETKANIRPHPFWQNRAGFHVNNLHTNQKPDILIFSDYHVLCKNTTFFLIILILTDTFPKIHKTDTSHNCITHIRVQAHMHMRAQTHTILRPFVWDYPGESVPPTQTFPAHQPSFVNFLHDP